MPWLYFQDKHPFILRPPSIYEHYCLSEWVFMAVHVTILPVRSNPLQRAVFNLQLVIEILQLLLLLAEQLQLFLQGPNHVVLTSQCLVCHTWWKNMIDLRSVYIPGIYMCIIVFWNSPNRCNCNAPNSTVEPVLKDQPLSIRKIYCLLRQVVSGDRFHCIEP